MKSQLLTLALSLVAVPALAKDATYHVVPQSSTIVWVGSKLVGSGHTGKVSVQSGTVVYAGDKVKSGEVLVDLSTIVDDDLKDPKWNKKLVDHLKSPDFFDVEKHKTARLVIDKVQYVDATRRKVKGTLTIKGKSKPITFEATESEGKDGKTIKADLVFDRTDFDVRYGSGKFFTDLGDKVIADDVKLAVELKLAP